MPCTVIEAGPCIVTQVRTDAVDGYEAVQLGFEDKSEKHVVKSEAGHLKRPIQKSKRKLLNFKILKKT